MNIQQSTDGQGIPDEGATIQMWQSYLRSGAIEKVDDKSADTCLKILAALPSPSIWQWKQRKRIGLLQKQLQERIKGMKGPLLHQTVQDLFEHASTTLLEDLIDSHLISQKTLENQLQTAVTAAAKRSNSLTKKLLKLTPPTTNAATIAFNALKDLPPLVKDNESTRAFRARIRVAETLQKAGAQASQLLDSAKARDIESYAVLNRARPRKEREMISSTTLKSWLVGHKIQALTEALRQKLVSETDEKSYHIRDFVIVCNGLTDEAISHSLANILTDDKASHTRKCLTTLSADKQTEIALSFLRESSKKRVFYSEPDIAFSISRTFKPEVLASVSHQWATTDSWHDKHRADELVASMLPLDAFLESIQRGDFAAYTKVPQQGQAGGISTREKRWSVLKQTSVDLLRLRKQFSDPDSVKEELPLLIDVQNPDTDTWRFISQLGRPSITAWQLKTCLTVSPPERARQLLSLIPATLTVKDENGLVAQRNPYKPAAEIFEKLLDRQPGAVVSLYIEENNFSPYLHEAMMAARKWVREQKDVEHWRDDKEGSIFHAAARHPHNEALGVLLNQWELNLEPDADGNSPMHLALQSGNQELFNRYWTALEDREETEKLDWNGALLQSNEQGKSLLSLAMELPDQTSARLMLKKIDWSQIEQVQAHELLLYIVENKLDLFATDWRWTYDWLKKNLVFTGRDGKSALSIIIQQKNRDLLERLKSEDLLSVECMSMRDARDLFGMALEWVQETPGTASQSRQLLDLVAPKTTQDGQPFYRRNRLGKEIRNLTWACAWCSDEVGESCVLYAPIDQLLFAIDKDNVFWWACHARHFKTAAAIVNRLATGSSDSRSKLVEKTPSWITLVLESRLNGDEKFHVLHTLIESDIGPRPAEEHLRFMRWILGSVGDQGLSHDQAQSLIFLFRPVDQPPPYTPTEDKFPGRPLPPPPPLRRNQLPSAPPLTQDKPPPYQQSTSAQPTGFPPPVSQNGEPPTASGGEGRLIDV